MNITFLKTKSFQSPPKKEAWDNQDIANFYRAVDILKQAGLQTETDSGVTDEGDPWFVFIKPESGDVIAHFAHVDGSFIAVSSLNHQVFRGNDIRSIVDQMLKTYPVLLPQNKGPGRLYLHPTAAISAFLAAAFILTIDGVKAYNIGDVLFNASDHSFEKSSNSQLVDSSNRVEHNAIFRSETLKVMFSDLNASNYTVAILGAALIAHELSHLESEFEKPFMPELYAENFNSRENIVEAHQQADSVAVPEMPETPIKRSVFNTSLRDANVIEKGDEKIKPNSEATLSQSTDPEERLLDATLSETEVKPENIFLQTYDVSWVGKSFTKVVQTPSSLIQKEKIEAEQTSDAEQVVETAQIQMLADEALAVVNIGVNRTPENLSLDPKISLALVDSSSPLRPEEIGITVEDLNDLLLFSLKPVDSISALNSFPEKVNHAFVNSNHSWVEGSEKPNNNGNIKEEVSIATEPSTSPETPLNSLPILGHSLDLDGSNLNLTDAIDVVFYQGGNSEITGFELGTDLLWFFLSPTDLAKAENGVNREGDLILDFGEIGTLTFLGVVPDQPVDLMV